MMLCNERDVPVVARGAGSGLAGGASPVSGGVVLDMSGMNRILEMDLENLQVIGDDHAIVVAGFGEPAPRAEVPGDEVVERKLTDTCLIGMDSPFL